MPNYKSSFFWFPNIAAMSSLLLDETDEDGLVFAVGTDPTNYRIAVWRKNSTATIDNNTVYAANGLGRWIVQQSPGSSLLTGTTPPTTIPLFIGAYYLNTTSGILYYAKGITSVADWVALATLAQALVL